MEKGALLLAHKDLTELRQEFNKNVMLALCICTHDLSASF